MQLPFFKSADPVLELLQTKWRSILNPLIAVPMNSGFQIDGVVLSASANVINHRLGRVQQGWIITDLNASTTIYRSQAFNDKTLTLTSSNAATINIWVF